MKLHNLKVGQTAIIDFVDNHRLAEVGLYEGVEVKMLIPGTSCLLLVGSMKIAVGKNNIIVKDNQ